MTISDPANINYPSKANLPLEIYKLALSFTLNIPTFDQGTHYTINRTLYLSFDTPVDYTDRNLPLSTCLSSFE